MDIKRIYREYFEQNVVYKFRRLDEKRVEVTIVDKNDRHVLAVHILEMS